MNSDFCQFKEPTSSLIKDNRELVKKLTKWEITPSRHAFRCENYQGTMPYPSMPVSLVVLCCRKQCFKYLNMKPEPYLQFVSTWKRRCFSLENTPRSKPSASTNEMTARASKVKNFINRNKRVIFLSFPSVLGLIKE